MFEAQNTYLEKFGYKIKGVLWNWELGTHHTIISGDSRQMTELKDNNVHLAITSPPLLATEGLWNR
ncbi:MAG: hypothetical protein NVSMB7_00690 [Chitinophagaceae bacterium]